MAGVETRPHQSVLFVFVDGIGLGGNDPTVNPLCAFTTGVLGIWSGIERLPRGGVCHPTDACLGIPGLPQSATGQTTLFTGHNAAEIVGRHIQGFPNGRLKNLIQQESLFQKGKALGLNMTFANVYTPRFFEKRPRWLSVTTTMCETAGISFRTLQDAATGNGLFMDFTNQFLIERGFDLPKLSPEEAASVLVTLSNQFDLCLYEYFLTDLIGHRGTLEDTFPIVSSLDRFLTAVIDLVDLDVTSVLVASDHGNLEDMRSGRHTLNPVPTMVWGGLQQAFVAGANRLDLTAHTPAILEFLSSKP